MVELDIGTAKIRQEIQTLKNLRGYFNHGKSIQSVVRHGTQPTQGTRRSVLCCLHQRPDRKVCRGRQEANQETRTQELRLNPS